MVEPNSKVTEARATHFVPDEKLAVFVCNQTFDAVWEKTTRKDKKTKEEKTYAKQKFKDLPDAQKDI